MDNVIGRRISPKMLGDPQIVIFCPSLATTHAIGMQIDPSDTEQKMLLNFSLETSVFPENIATLRPRFRGINN
jgi:hypothetical protein